MTDSIGAEKLSPSMLLDRARTVLVVLVVVQVGRPVRDSRHEDVVEGQRGVLVGVDGVWEAAEIQRSHIALANVCRDRASCQRWPPRKRPREMDMMICESCVCSLLLDEQPVYGSNGQRDATD